MRNCTVVFCGFHCHEHCSSSASSPLLHTTCSCMPVYFITFVSSNFTFVCFFRPRLSLVLHKCQSMLTWLLPAVYPLACFTLLVHCLIQLQALLIMPLSPACPVAPLLTCFLSQTKTLVYLISDVFPIV